MGEELNMNATSFSKIELGKVNITVERLFQIAGVLEVNASEFLSDPIANIKENKNPNYGYASKSEVDNLSHLVQTLIKEIEKLRSELPKTPARKKTKGR